MDYVEFPEDAVTGKADHRHRRSLRAQTMGPAGRYAAENAYQRATASAEAGIACRVCQQLELVATSLAKARFRSECGLCRT